MSRNISHEMNRVMYSVCNPKFTLNDLKVCVVERYISGGTRPVTDREVEMESGGEVYIGHEVYECQERSMVPKYVKVSDDKDGLYMKGRRHGTF